MERMRILKRTDTAALALAMAAAVIALSLPRLATAGEHTIIQKDKKFDKTTLTIKKGDAVNFSNEEKDITHNVYSLGPKNAFELKTQPPKPSKDSSSKVVFNEVGDTEVECAIHTDMKLKIKVE